jgi:hypothetical protein
MGAVNPVAGAIYGAASNQDETAMQVGGSAAQVTTVAVSSSADDTTYTLSIGEDAGSLTAITFTTPSSGNTTSTIATGLANAINAKVGVSNLVFADTSTNTINITGRQKGASATFTVSESDSRLGTPSTTTSAGDATAIPFGVMVERSSATKAVGTAAIGSAVGSGTYTAQVDTSEDLTGKSITTNDYISLAITGDFDGKGRRSYSADVVFRSSVDDTVGDLANAMNAALPASSVAVVAAAGVLTLTAEVAGVGFEANGGFTESGTADVIDFTATTANAIPLGGGVALKSHTIEQDDNGDSEYGMGDTFSGLTEGKCYVLLDSGITVAEGDACFVRKTTPGTEQAGAFSNVSDSGNNLPIGSFGFKGVWVGGNVTDMNGNNVAPLYISRA